VFLLLLLRPTGGLAVVAAAAAAAAAAELDDGERQGRGRLGGVDVLCAIEC